jgi:hypothetical protein
MNPRTKHIAVKYHHFREAAVSQGYLNITRVATDKQLADILLTKPVLPFLTTRNNGMVIYV